ncbi:MAG: hypothetical protein ACLRIS_00335 [Flavonifractor plautii]
MERFSLAGGQGWLTVEESGGRARCAAELPEDGKGLYKGYLCGTGGRALLGTFLPEDGRLKLRRTLSLDELRRQGAWPPTGARAELAFSAGSPGGPHSPEGWHWEEAPARRMGNPCWPGRLAGAGAVPAGTGGFSLAFPYAETRAFPLTPLFCFARVERMNGEFYAVFPFGPAAVPGCRISRRRRGKLLGQTKQRRRRAMANLTTKELTALSDQLNFEKTLYCKYQEAAQECTEEDLKPCFQQYADQHRQNYDCLLGYLK